MPHPTRVNEEKNIRLKRDLTDRCRDDYIFAFDSKDYGDVNIYNKLGKSTKGSSAFLKGFATLFHSESTKPVVFFLTYDIGDRPEINTFIRHVICCIAVREKDSIHVFVFDMRNLEDIANGQQNHLESELKKITHSPLPIHILNVACLERSKCTYLQRFKKFEDPGWCIAWAMFFLDAAICRPVWKGKYVYELSVSELKHAFAKMYRLVDDQLVKHGNGFIEDWYVLGL